jgi:hypothetical protein
MGSEATPHDTTIAGVAKQIEEWLTEHDYTVVDPDDADLHLVFQFESRETLRRSADSKMVHSGGPGGLPSPGGGARFYEYDEVFVHSFSAAVVDADAFRTTGEERVIWKGQAVLDEDTKNPSDTDKGARSVLDLLRRATFEFFGERCEPRRIYMSTGKNKRKKK